MDGEGTFTIDATVESADTGWDKYADQWDVVDPGGVVLGTRVLAHPHDTEQPFTRTLSRVEIPEAVRTVNAASAGFRRRILRVSARSGRRPLGLRFVGGGKFRHVVVILGLAARLGGGRNQQDRQLGLRRYLHGHALPCRLGKELTGSAHHNGFG